jgi:hypothetical protein
MKRMIHCMAIALTLTVTVGPAATAPALAARDGARSADVFLINNTGCALGISAAIVDRGVMVRQPPAQIAQGSTASWRSESNGMATGTEGRADYFTFSCNNPLNSLRRINLYWYVPFIGPSEYNADLTGPRIIVDIQGDNASHATVRFTFSAPQ